MTTHPTPRFVTALVATLALVASVLAGAFAPAANAAEPVVFDDMEHGDPGANGWFSFNGAVGGGGIGATETDLPPTGGGTFSLETGWGSGGTPGFYGGFGRTNPTDLTGTDHFNLWINPNAAQEYTLEINLQEDDTSDGAAEPAVDDEFQFNCVVGATGPCAVAGGGWQLVSIPLADFVDDNSFFTGGNGLLDATVAGNGQLINIVIAVIGTGSDVNLRTDLWTFTDGPADGGTGSAQLVDGFDTGAAPGVPCGELDVPIGFCTFNGAGSAVTISTETTPPAPVLDEVGEPNSVLQMDIDSTSFAGFIRGFESGGEWVSQDWSAREGIRFWFYGEGSGAQMFLDVLENRNPGSTVDDAERQTVGFVDDTAGWTLREFTFDQFSRKEIGNGAPADGFDRFEVHGWALGALGTFGPRTFYVDQVEVFGDAPLPPAVVQLAQQNTFVEEGETAEVVVRLNRPLGEEDPDVATVDYATERSNAIADEEYTPVSGTLTFEKGGATEQVFLVETTEDSRFEGDEQVVIRLSNVTGVERGDLFQGSVLIDDDDAFDPTVIDEFTFGAYLWDTEGSVAIDRTRVGDTEALARPDQDAVEDLAVVTGLPVSVEIVERGARCPDGRAARGGGRGVVPVQLLSSETVDATTIDLTTLTIGGASETHTTGRSGDPVRHVEDVNGDGLDDLVVHLRRSDITTPCGEPLVVDGTTLDGTPITSTGGEADAAVVRDFASAQDWTDTESVSFWYRGNGGGEDVTVTLQDNRAPDPGPAGWDLVWSDEFDDAAGTVPNEDNWSYELGDTTPDGKNGWGNEELQYYTDDPANASTDGDGNLVITLDEADGTQECYYGACEYSSARLITQHKAEFEYGRIESRVLVPDGGDGLWPAVWSLGTDINYNPWPGAGEIDIMEYVSRLPEEIFGTVHGPGYAGGASIGDIYDFGAPVYEAPRADGTDDGGYHTFTVEWEPDLITWYVDDVQYHQVTPADVPGPWVFDKPFFLLLNFAIGGNFGGSIDPDNVYPQDFFVDYVRVYQGPDTAERFETSFTDDVDGWQQVTVPLTDFTRSDQQPDGAPDDGLTLDEVWGIGLSWPEGSSGGDVALDAVQRILVPPPTELVVTSLADSGEGSLRAALASIADGGTITVDSSFAGQTIALDGQLVAQRSVTIDASDAPGLVLSAGGQNRVLEVAPGVTVAANDLVIADGVTGPRGGGVLNNGTLELTRVVVRDNVVDTPGPANFAFGGGGIFTADGGTLVLTDSTVANNAALNQPGGGLYGSFGSDITIVRSTIVGNLGGDVAGGLRSLGDATVVDSTFSGNTSTAWHGGGIFHTDGSLTVTGSTFAENVAPDGTASGIVVATFGAPADLTVTNSVMEGFGGAFACAIEGGGAATISSGGGNVISDGSCNPTTDDLSSTDALLGPLADNGGPTLTHLPAGASPAIDAAVDTACSATDQRGVLRPQGAGCDAGAVEVETG